MQKLILILLFLSFCSFVHADDRIRVQVQFKKVVWTCPKDGQEDFEDRPMSGGASYIHKCSKCGYEFNQSGSNMKEYNGTVDYTETEWAGKTDEDLATKKQDKVDKWLYDVKHPPAYVEPSETDITNMINDHMTQVEELGKKLKEKATPETVDEVGDTVIEKGQKIKE